MAKAKFFHEIRLSANFVMSDFLQSPAFYESGCRLKISDLNPTALQAGKYLCNDLLEPLVKEFGPVSVGAGYVRKDFCKSGHPPDSPHFWKNNTAAADVVVHNWVNQGNAPINLVNTGKLHPFERFISYAGSEYVCLTYKPRGRYRVLENRRNPGAASTRMQYDASEMPVDIPIRHQWRRTQSEIPSNSRELRAHHIRVGEYFTLLDFCRSPYAYESGFPWVVPPGHEPQTTYARMAAELLDPVVKRWGRTPIVRGLMPRQLAEKEENPSLWTWRAGPAAVEFIPPVGSSSLQIRLMLSTLRADQHIYDAEVCNWPSGMQTLRLYFSPFTPATMWKSWVRDPSKGRVIRV